mmetsp:Transcript_5672/g.35264  ORF Transcript_5672/g.35264 Transcript_5672/m.35264 type:complete len:205 (-) Transcript_5672:18-632(-)
MRGRVFFARLGLHAAAGLLLGSSLWRFVRSRLLSAVSAIRTCAGPVGWRGSLFRGGTPRLPAPGSSVHNVGSLPTWRRRSHVACVVSCPSFRTSVRMDGTRRWIVLLLDGGWMSCLCGMDLRTHVAVVWVGVHGSKSGVDPCPAVGWVSTRHVLCRVRLPALVSTPPSSHPRGVVGRRPSACSPRPSSTAIHTPSLSLTHTLSL